MGVLRLAVLDLTSTLTVWSLNHHHHDHDTTLNHTYESHIYIHVISSSSYSIVKHQVSTFQCKASHSYSSMRKYSTIVPSPSVDWVSIIEQEMIWWQHYRYDSPLRIDNNSLNNYSRLQRREWNSCILNPCYNLFKISLNESKKTMMMMMTTKITSSQQSLMLNPINHDPPCILRIDR